MDQYSVIRLLALRSVVKPDADYIIRKTIRWYAKTFHTPIKDVEEIPLEDVFQAFFEERYEAMSREDLMQERENLLTTPEEYRRRVEEEEAEEADMFVMSRLVAAEQAAKKKAEQAKTLEGLAKNPLQNSPLRREIPEATLGLGQGKMATETIPPNISMKFLSEEEFEAELTGFGLVDRPD